MSTFTSALASIFKAVRNALLRDGVNVGGTAQMPRVEIHSVVEDAPQTKDNAVRSITCTIECVSSTKVADVVDLLEGNVQKLFADAGLSLSGYDIIGIVPGQIRLFDEQEAQDSMAVFYRLLQDVTVWVEKTPDPDPAPTTETEVAEQTSDETQE